ncbi:MAG TPA: SMC-Scp complex subunit ScpB, partial [Burkholderiaceae bacterium]|nr:SMC-Scp complex subunit ScpB [Burkholderiaceae bacterium]
MSDVAWTGGENLMSAQAVHRILETILLCSGGPVSLKALLQVFSEEDAATVPAMTASDLRKHLTDLQQAWEDKGLALVEVAGGWQFQSRPDMQVFLDRLEARRPLRYSRALLETLAIVAWHQPVTRGDIEDIRGVSVSTPIMRTLQDRGWIEVLGHRDAPGRPSLFGTTQQFL